MAAFNRNHLRCIGCEPTAFFLLFAGVKGYALVAVEGLVLADALPRIWDDETAALFAAVMSFWFGSRSLARLRQGR